MHLTNSTVYEHQRWHESSATSLQPYLSKLLLLGMVLLEHSHVHVFLYCLWLLLHCTGRAEKVPQGPCGTQSPTCLPWGPSQIKLTNLWFSTTKIYSTPIVYQIMKSLFCWKISASHKYLINPCDSSYMHVPPAPHLSNGCIIASTPECLQHGQCLERIKCPINISHNYHVDVFIEILCPWEYYHCYFINAETVSTQDPWTY